MRLDGWAPALEGGIVRRYLAENLSVAKWLEARQEAAVLKMLLVVNPTKDLDGAKQEGARIKATFGSHPGVQITERFEDQATKAALLKDFSSGQYDVIHYAGHAFFDPANPSRSGILCAGHQVLSGADIAGVGRLPNLIVFNACESGRLRNAQVKGGTKLLNLGQQIQRSVGMAEAFLRGGAANYLGTYWPVGDDSATKFAEVFFESILNGNDLGDSILAGRRALADFSVDWADYIFYGSPEFVLKKKKQ
jgi:CHAT domain-containing protein